MKKLLIFFIGVTSLTTVFAQTETIGTRPTTFDGFHKNIFVEGLGANLLVGLNYDMRLQRGRMDGIGFRVGVGGAALSGTDIYGEPASLGGIVMPIECNYLIGKNRSSLLTGIGILPSYGFMHGNAMLDSTYERVSINEQGFGIGGAYLSLGYRLQPLRNGFMFQINWNPIFSSGEFFPKWFGISIGYGFK